ncbi:hypothetical protein CDL15_Pgr028031 [Punica granatum]|nr:hypothetical protein CDL15_Pgr028031 [Punica granatum]PKI51586.1 hypothetical protein CRG98_028010 [Punica granatum]
MENRYASFDSGRSPSKYGAGSRLIENSRNKEDAGYAANNRRMLNDSINDRFGGDNEETTLHRYEPVKHFTARRGFQEAYPRWNDPTRLLNVRSSRAGNDRLEEWEQRFQAFSINPAEPRHGAPPFYGYGQPTASRHEAYGPDEVENLEMDRAELLRKLEELNYQISRSKEPEQRLPINRNMVPSVRHNARSPHYNWPAAYPGCYNMGVSNISSLPGNFQDTFGPQLAGTSSRYVHNSSNRAFLKENMEFIDPELFESYPRDPFPPQPPSSRMIVEERFDLQFQHRISPAQVRPKVAHQVDPDSSRFLSQDQSQPRERWSVNRDSDNSGSLSLASSKMALASIKSRKHRPALAGGAPFLICSNCFSLLKLPRRLRIKEKGTEKTCCGSCSAVIYIKLQEKRLITRIIEDSPDKASNEGPSSKFLNKGGSDRSSSPRLIDSGSMTSYNDPEQNISSISEETAFSREEVYVGRNEKPAGFNSSFSPPLEDHEGAKEEENGNLKDLIIQNADHTSPILPASPLQNSPQNSTSMIVHQTQQENEKSSDDSNQEKAFLRKIDSPHKSYKDNSEITEVEVSASEYPITSLSQDSIDTSREEDQPKNKKGGGRSFFKGLLNRSVREQPRPEPSFKNERPEVTINGHPIPDSFVKQVEVRAGPICPGDYWYDYHSGFWGVMKYPCLGIIPPFIEEFNYPMPTNCSAGDTGIFVNGRQLHQHDLKLLASRGLPTTRNQFYIIDISGKVIDEDTDEELYDLGKLAPTVVKSGRGFGMRVPKGMM